MPGSALSFSRDRRSARPDYLGADDQPWLRAMLDEYQRFAGMPLRSLREHLRPGLALAAPAARQALATSVLDQLCVEKPRPMVKPAALRAALFTAAAARSGEGRPAIVAAAAQALGVPADRVDDFLFADLPHEHLVTAPPASLSPLQLALRCNLAMAQRLVRRAERVVIEVRGTGRAVVRLARLRGLICTATRTADDDEWGQRLELSGPLALFRRTITYGRALASLLPGLAWCDDFRFRAWCQLDGNAFELELRAGDPIFPAAEGRRSGSLLEDRFAREFGRATGDWDLVREPEAVVAGDHLVFPDFALQHRGDRSRRWLVEVVGFWTAEYLIGKLDRLRRAGIANLILCIDARRDCGGELPRDPRIVSYRSRIDPQAVLRAIDSADRGLPYLIDDGGAVAARGLEVEHRAQVIAGGAAIEARRQPGGGVAIDAGRRQNGGAGPGGDARRYQGPPADRAGAGQVELPVDRLEGDGGVVRVADREGELDVDPHHRCRADDDTVELDPGSLDRTLDTGAPGHGQDPQGRKEQP